MPDNESEKSGGYLKAGLVVGAVLIILALIISGLGNIKIEKKKPTTSKKVEVSKEKDTSTNKVSSTDVVLSKVVNEDLLDYSGVAQVVNGVIASKSIYLKGNQIVYSLDIEIGIGASHTVVNYYCPYDTFDSVKVNDTVSVTYKQVSKSAFAVMNVKK